MATRRKFISTEFLIVEILFSSKQFVFTDGDTHGGTVTIPAVVNNSVANTINLNKIIAVICTD